MKAYKLNILVPEDKSQLENMASILDSRLVSMIGGDVNLDDYLCEPSVDIYKVDKLTQYMYLPKEIDIHEFIVDIADFDLIESWEDITEEVKRDYTQFIDLTDKTVEDMIEYGRTKLLINFLIKVLTVDDVLEYITKYGEDSLNDLHKSALKGWSLCKSIEELDSDTF